MFNIVISIIAIAIIVPVVIILIKKHKRKIPREDIKPEKISEVQEKKIPDTIYCRECGTEILDKTRKFCSVCGAPLK